MNYSTNKDRRWTTDVKWRRHLHLGAITLGLLMIFHSANAIQNNGSPKRLSNSDGHNKTEIRLDQTGLSDCGDSILDPGEQCDDGNSVGTDGCSSTCQIENGFVCSAPVPGENINAIPDGGFESGYPSPYWQEFASNFDTPLCDVQTCGVGSSSGPHEGNWWLWLGGTATTPDLNMIEQTFLFPSEQTFMTFSVENKICDSAMDYAEVSIDGNVVFRVTGDDANCGVEGYRQIEIDLTLAEGGPYNTDSNHTLRIESETFATNHGISNFFFDHFLIDVGDVPPQASVCRLEKSLCFSEDFDSLTDDTWISFVGVSTVTSRVWGNTNDNLCGSVNGSPGNFAGTGIAACIDSDAAGVGNTDAYYCSPALNFGGVSVGVLSFNYNYQVFQSADPNDVFTVSVGTTVPNLPNLGGYTQVFSAAGIDAGSFGVDPEVGSSSEVRIDLSRFDGQPNVHICFHYVGNFDWYAQIDDVEIAADNCKVLFDTDSDGVDDSIDNCTDVANADQSDSNGDGIGNLCDFDWNNDCVVNFLDLALFPPAFNTALGDPNFDTDIDVTSDGVINFFDFARVGDYFLGPPGPSAEGCN